jgi:carboxynorspermidine decarboxylase
MERDNILNFDLSRVETPCFIVDTSLVERNLKILASVKERTGCRILLAQKAFSMWSLYPLISRYLDGSCASSPYEARLAREHLGKEVHVFAAAYSQKDIDEIVQYADHIVFNSFFQLERFRAAVAASGRTIDLALRINPEHSEGTHAIYDPCQEFSRLGITRANFHADRLEGIKGLHFHTLCQHNAQPLERTIGAVEEKFGEFLAQMEYVNFGGGHHITRDDYDIDLLCSLITRFKEKYGVEVYLEPGEAVALNTGYLAATVLDVIDNGMKIAVLDASAAAHMPDVIEMPYRPYIIGSGEAHEKAHTYRLGGHSCLAGDIIGDYSFDAPLTAGDRLLFTDMSIYSMVKTNTFNGLALPSILTYDAQNNECTLVRRFGYEDFKNRLS